MKFPLQYVDLNYPEDDLLEITHADWFHDVDTHHTIGPNQSNEQYVIDSNGELFSVLYTGMDSSNVPMFEFESCDNQSKLNTVNEYIEERTL